MFELGGLVCSWWWISSWWRDGNSLCACLTAQFAASFCYLWKTSQHLLRNRSVWTRSVFTETGFSSAGFMCILMQLALCGTRVLADVCDQSTWLTHLSEAFSQRWACSHCPYLTSKSYYSIFHPLLFVNKTNKLINPMNSSPYTKLIVFTMSKTYWIVPKYWLKMWKWQLIQALPEPLSAAEALSRKAVQFASCVGLLPFATQHLSSCTSGAGLV